MTDSYFAALSAALDQEELHRPVLVIDRDRLDRNIDRMAGGLPAGVALRVVDKSLPSLPLIAHVMQRSGSTRLMTFHLPFTLAMLGAFPQAELLFGKPMPARAAAHALENASDTDRHGLVSRTVWLIDTIDRLRAYAALGAQAGARLRIAFEVDAGVRRGGLADPQALREILALARSEPALKVEGLMAYEAHIAEVPGSAREQQRVIERLEGFIACLAPDERTILNTGGSKTALLYGRGTKANDFSAGSGLLLPSDFDTPGLKGFEPAAFIATPVLKVGPAHVPGPTFLSRVLKAVKLFPERCCYVYGGAWMARAVHPPGVRENRIWGKSSNQQFMAIPDNLLLQPDDRVFFRPTQSEAVLQHFGSIAVFSQGHIVDWWQPLPTG